MHFIGQAVTEMLNTERVSVLLYNIITFLSHNQIIYLPLSTMDVISQNPTSRMHISK